MARVQLETEWFVARPEIHVPEGLLVETAQSGCLLLTLGERVYVRDFRPATINASKGLTTDPGCSFPLPPEFGEPSLVTIEEGYSQIIVISLYPLPVEVSKRCYMMLNIEHISIGQTRNDEWLSIDFSGEFRWKESVLKRNKFGYSGDAGDCYVVTITENSRPGYIRLEPNQEYWDLAYTWKKPELITLGNYRIRKEQLY